ncbi:MAG TPA: monovalent cation/H+ antiporter complex subunit F [Streptomyces sp.]|nr:monovalent cation/H+ antiporter complex subunit F [Streptomyces sp.]
MKTAYLYAAIALTAGFLPLVAVCMRARPIDGLVALELGGAMATVTVVCLAVGFQSTSTTGLALIMAVTTWAGSLVVARFLDRDP